MPPLFLPYNHTFLDMGSLVTATESQSPAAATERVGFILCKYIISVRVATES